MYASILIHVQDMRLGGTDLARSSRLVPALAKEKMGEGFGGRL